MTTENNNSYSISVVIPAYNVAGYIGRALDSVLAQSHPADEIIVIDDGSGDDTEAVVRRYDPPVRYLRQANSGANTARNHGIEVATGNWIAFLDADDEWLKDKLRLQIELLRHNPDLWWTTANYYRRLTDQNRQSCDIAPGRIEKLHRGTGYFDSFFTAFAAGLWGHTDTMLIRRDLLLEAGLFRPGLLWADDLDMWFRIAFHRPKIGYLSEPLAIHYLDSGNITRQHKPVDMLCEVIAHNIELAVAHNCSNEFKPCAVLMTRKLIRSMLFDRRAEDIRKMMEQLDELLPGWYKRLLKLLTTFPGMTANACHAISRVVRFLHLRRRLTRPPK